MAPGSRVVVAMSGGVDSSVAAALLAQAGHEVVGITLQLYDHGAAVGRQGACCAGRDIHDARRVAERLGIAHYVLDREARFRKAVIDDFVDTYAAGRTPVPCVRCNERIKFRDLLEIARDLGAAALATGHYARKVMTASGPELRRAVDPSKDQSYFLFATTLGQLDYLRFPLGRLKKERTREIAAELGLPVAEKPDSQDICFIPNGHYSELVAKLRPDAMRPGEIVHRDGRVLGRHDGVARYTVGQRRGLRVADREPLYVVAIDPLRHRVVVGPRRAGESVGCRLEAMNWLVPPARRSVMVKHRYNEAAVAALIEPGGGGEEALDPTDGGGAVVTFALPQAGVAPGQACVLYDADRVVGGGWIAETRPSARAGDVLDRPEAAA